MTIIITKDTGGVLRADCKDMPGTPPVGIGNTSAQAVAHLFLRLISETLSTATPTDWLSILKQTDTEGIDIQEKW